jgi:tungstate transport system permease protein
VEFLLKSFWESLQMIARLDRDLLSALATTLKVATTSTVIASMLALPLGFSIARHTFPGKRAVQNLLRTALALPTVVVGLLVYAFIARNAPLGEMRLLFTPAAIIIGQVLLIVPLITALVHAALEQNIQVIYEESLILGASPFQASIKALIESRLAVMTAIMTGFGRVVSEVGISLVLGGNIRGLTRTITTAITLETSQGDFAVAFALGMVLLALVLLVNVIIIQTAGEHREAL